jgi:hypothetical protein
MDKFYLIYFCDRTDKFTIYVSKQSDVLQEVLTRNDSVTAAPQPSSHKVPVSTVSLKEETYSSVKLSGSYNVKREFGSIKHIIESTNIKLTELPTTPSDCKIVLGTSATDENDRSLTNCNEDSVSTADTYTIFVKEMGSFKKYTINAIPVPANLDPTTIKSEKDLLNDYFTSVEKHLKNKILVVNSKIAGLKNAFVNASDLTDLTFATKKDNIDAEIVKIDDHEAGTTLLNKTQLETTVKTNLDNNKTTNADVKAYAEALIEKVNLLIEIETKSKEYENRDTTK